jgi:Flp pilus assembly protein TadG
VAGPSRGNRRRDHRGAAAVEFALLLPVLMLVVFASIQYGMYFWAMQGGSDIARDAARRAAVGEPATCLAFRQDVRANIDSLTGSGAAATITRTYQTATPATVQVGDVVTVTVKFSSFDMQVPFLPFVNDGEVSSTVKSRVDFVPQQPESCP